MAILGEANRDSRQINLSLILAFLIVLLWTGYYILTELRSQGSGFIFVLIILPVSFIVNLISLQMALSRKEKGKPLPMKAKAAIFLNLLPYAYIGLFMIYNSSLVRFR